MNCDISWLQRVTHDMHLNIGAFRHINSTLHSDEMKKFYMESLFNYVGPDVFSSLKVIH